MIIPDYESIDKNGNPYIRKARVVGELDHKDRFPALKIIADILGVERIAFGAPLWDTLGMTKEEAIETGNKYLLLKGDEMPLDILTINDHKKSDS